jgi:hypothetical protein
MTFKKNIDVTEQLFTELIEVNVDSNSELEAVEFCFQIGNISLANSVSSVRFAKKRGK